MNLNLKSSLFINENLSLKNRVVVPPMASGTATKDGFVTTETINHYERLAGSRASLVMVEYTYISADIEEIKKSFLRAAKRAHVAGFNIIELHSAHGYGLNQWLSPITNKRTDKYGGIMKNRSRILLEIIDSIKEHIPEVVLSVRIPGQDHFIGGLSYGETSALALSLQKTGVDIINVSSGIGGWRRPRNRNGEGYLVDDAEIISRSLSIPVTVGRAILNDPTWGLNVGLS